MEKMRLLNRSLSEIPSEVIQDILCRLPIKSCLKCKLVCKGWYKIITSPDFTRSRRCYCSRLVTLLLFGRFPNGRLNFLVMELDKGSCIVDQLGNIRVGTHCMIKFRSKFDVPNGKLRVLNVCNGLVCLKSNKAWGSYYICNLLTSRFVKVEQVQVRHHYLHGCVLGSCPMTHQYKLLRILRTRTKYLVEILTLGSNEWRRIDDAPKSYPMTHEFQAFLHGSIHWYNIWDGECNIEAFHFGTEKFVHIPTPDEFKVKPYSTLTVFDSCLCFCCVVGNGPSENEFWLMKEYGVGHSWVRLLVLHVPQSLWFRPYRPLVRMDDGQILISHYNSQLAFYDPETRAYKEVEVDDISVRRLAACDADSPWILGAVQSADTQGLHENNLSL